jgi:hypothetical protein
MRVAIPLLAVLLAAPAHAGEGQAGEFLTLTCPAKGNLTRSFDLSTGVAPWIAIGPGLPEGRPLATAIDETSLPRGWSARLPGAQWVQGLPVSRSVAHAPGDYQLVLEIEVPKAKRRPRLRLSGEAIGDEGFDLTLIEPAPANTGYVQGSGFGDDSPGVAPQDEVQPILLELSADQSRRPLGVHAGRYRIEIAVPNSTAEHAALGLLARLQLTMTCGKK